jgi:hypothetical protein
LTGGNIQGFSTYGVSNTPLLFVSSTDGSEFDFIGGQFNEIFDNQNDTLTLTGYKDRLKTDTFCFSTDSVKEISANMFDVDEIYVAPLGLRSHFVFDDLVSV